MSFRKLNSLFVFRSNNINEKLRKEEDSDRTQNQFSPFPEEIERTSLFTSFRGSILVEASLVIPLFFFAMCCLCYLLEIMAVQITVHSAMHSAAKEALQEIYVAPVIFPSRLERDIVEQIGAERLERSVVVGGSSGLDCSQTLVSPKTGIARIHVAYKVKVPFLMFGNLSMSCEDEFRVKGWTGYVKEGFSPGREDIVYVTETGLVYHRDPHCSYLDLSIQMVAQNSIQDLRNEYQEKYRPCLLCGRNAGGMVYITSQGNRYHSSVECSGLKRSVYAVPLSEVLGKGACSRCGY